MHISIPSSGTLSIVFLALHLNITTNDFITILQSNARFNSFFLYINEYHIVYNHIQLSGVYDVVSIVSYYWLKAFVMVFFFLS